MSTLSHSSEETMTGPNSTEPENQTISQNALDVEASGYQKSSMPEAQMANDLVPAASAVGGHGGGPGGKPKLDKFAYSFFAPEMTHFRKIIFKILGGTTMITLIVMWTCLPLYWGSLWKANRYTDKLTVRVIDRDGGGIGSAISQGLLSQSNPKYFYTSPTEFQTDAEVEHDLVEEGAWAAIVIQQGVTHALDLARSIGNANYNGSQAISVYYAQARQESALGSYLVPLMQASLGQLTAQVSAQSAAQYLSANAGNATAINLLAQAPTTISSSVYYTLNNVRPYDQPVASAITLVGLIYMLIFAFTITMTNAACRDIISPFLNTRSYLIYRLAVPMTLYSVISVFFAMINLPFKVKFGAHFTYGGGFFLWCFTLYLGMSSVGLATEFAITILGPRFVAFFLIPLIIVNVSVASLPHELQPWIYKYGRGMPFYNVGRAVRTIIFNTKNELGMNLGILLGWIALSFITIPLATWFVRRKSVNAQRRAKGEEEMVEKSPNGR